MHPTIYFADKSLIFLKAEEYCNIASTLMGTVWHTEHDGEVSRAKILKIFETDNTIYIITDSPELEFERFKSQFRVVVAAGGALLSSNGDIMMIYRNERWDLPKGHWEEDETLEECALREVEEETGVKPDKLHRLLCKTWHAYNIYGEWELKHTYWYKMSVEGKPIPTPQFDEGILLSEWCERKVAVIHAIESYPTIQRVFEALD